MRMLLWARTGLLPSVPVWPWKEGAAPAAELLRGMDEGSGGAAVAAAAAKGCELRKLPFPGAADVWTPFTARGIAPLGMVEPPFTVAEPLGSSLLVLVVPLNQGCAAGAGDVGDRSSVEVPLHDAKGEGAWGRLAPSPTAWACGCGVGRSEKEAPRTRDWAKLGGIPRVASANSAARAFGSSALMPSPTWWGEV